MEIGIINVPYSLDYVDGKKAPREISEWDLQVTRWADQFGLSEAYFAEHFTIGQEPSPVPEYMIAAASQMTEQIKLGAAAHLLPYHHPASLAIRLMWLDHMTGGRYIAGIAQGGFPTDAQLFATGENNAEMMREALDIILAIWTKEGPFRIEGKYWTVDMPGFEEMWAGPHLKPLTKPHPPLAMVGMQPASPTLTHAGKMGVIPISQTLGVPTLRAHWDAYSEAAEEAGHEPRRSDWRIVRDIIVADTDEEARDLVKNGMIGRVWGDHNLPLFKALGIAGLIADIAEEDLTVDYLMDEFWILGSPDTVVEKLDALQQETGGFQTLLGLGYDYSATPEAYRHHFELLGTEVLPRVKDFGPGGAATYGAVAGSAAP